VLNSNEVGWRGKDEVRPFYESAGFPARRRLLLISYHFPPGRAAGALRWEKMSDFAAERGWALDVITLDPAGQTEPDCRRLDRLPSGIRLYGVPTQRSWLDSFEDSAYKIFRRLRLTLDGTAASKPAGTQQSSDDLRVPALEDLHWPPRNLRDCRKSYDAWRDYDKHGRWARRAAQIAMKIVPTSGCDAVITCGPPHMAHEAGRLVSSATGLPLVVDMRDPWSLVQRLPESLASPVWRQLARRYEQPIIEQASLVVANTEPARIALAEQYPRARTQIITVTNGYDEEPLPGPSHRRCFLMVYAGTVYLDRNPSVLLKAAGRVVREIGLSPTQFSIVFIGAMDTDLQVRDLATRENLTDFVRVEPPRPRQELFELLAGAAMLVSLSQDSDLAVPSKVFEYLRFHAWVLALADEGSATEMVLRGTGADIVAADDVDALTTVLRNRYQQFAAGVRPTPLASRTNLSRRTQASIFFDALEKVLHAKVARESPLV
jgi:glycosyltransferase involved in cell wall biosynthesis